ncbi:MAG: NAD(P)-dependent oxidoreductase [Candidatus Bipolaricaulota bacterium]
MNRQRGRQLRVHIHSPPPSYAIEELRAALEPKIELSFGGEALPRETELLVCGRPTREQLALCPQLRVLVIPYAGVPASTRELVLSEFPELTVCNLHHNAAVAAELAVSLLLAAAKKVVAADVALRQGDWTIRYEGESMKIMDGKTVLILGLGAIGSRVAAVCHSLGMKVLAVRKNPEQVHPPYIGVHGLGAVGAVLAQADAVVICLPLTPETEGLIGKRELEALPSSAVVVNVARGRIVGEEALYHALLERRIAAAGIDVWYRYPRSVDERGSTFPSQFPFHKLDNVVMSPHRGGAFRTEEVERKRMHELAETLNAIARGEPVPHRVDLVAGY